jgi:CheY-like chemotaxis protein
VAKRMLSCATRGFRGNHRRGLPTLPGSLILILSDINISGMSGLELLPKAKAVRPDVPIIMITAYGDPETKRQAFENGAEALLTKPIDSRRCAVRSTAASGAPHSRSKFPEFVCQQLPAAPINRRQLALRL